MNLFAAYRDARSCQDLVDAIRQRATRRWSVMEVCGGQTHGLLKYGIDQLLADQVRLIHGPGCPVCVTPETAIDQAISLALQPGVLLTTFGDMLRVPGTERSLLQARAAGAQVRMVLSPLDAVQLAQQTSEQQIVFFAVGFETTIPSTALAIAQAHALNLSNFSVLNAHVRVQPAMELLVQEPGVEVDGFLAAGHVCTVVGYDSYAEFARQHQRPVVVTGFEPVDLLLGILQCVELLETGDFRVVNCYERSVDAKGNPTAATLIDDIFVAADCEWRGLGRVPLGGFDLRPTYHMYDAARRFQLTDSAPTDRCSPCRSAEVLTGKLLPTACQYFGRECTPLVPLGAPMVSSEGACAAYYRYAQQEPHP